MFIFLLFLPVIFPLPELIGARDAYATAEQTIREHYSDAYLVSLVGGYIPTNVDPKEELRPLIEGGMARFWEIEYYSPEKGQLIKVNVKGNKSEIAYAYTTSKAPPKPPLEKWKLDSPEAFEIAMQVAVDSNKGDYVPVMIELMPNASRWRVTFFPKKVKEKTLAFWVEVSSDTGEVLRTGETEYTYIVIG